MSARMVLVFVIASVAAGFAATVADPVVLLMTLSLLAVIGIAAARGEHLLLSPLGPMMLVIVTSGLIPAARGYLSSTPLMGISHGHYVKASMAFAIFVLTVLAVYAPDDRRLPRPSRVWRPQDGGDGAVLAIWMGCVVFALFALFVAAGGGLGSYIAALADRRVFLEGRTWVTWALITPSITTLVLMGMWGPSLLRMGFSRRYLAILLLTTSVVFLFLTGNRMNVVSFAAALAVVVHYRIRRLAIRHVAIGVLVIGIIGLSIPNFLRPRGGSQRAVRVRTLDESLEDIERAGPISDFGQVAGLAMVISDPPNLPRQLGKTYLAGATIALPRALFPWKLPGAGQVATEALLPRVWKYGGTGIQISAVGEGYLNVGWLGVVIAAIAYGIGLRYLRRIGMRRDLFGVVTYAVCLPRVALFFRGEFANVLAFLMMELSIVFVCFVVLRKRMSRPSETSAQGGAAA